jgi:kynurenine formamidase
MGRWVNRPEGSNWGDFGPDDQIGRMNLLTPEVRRGGLAEAREGIAFTLSLPLDYPGVESPFRRPPQLFAHPIGDQPGYNFRMGSCGVMCDDGVTLYTQYSTQWDSLAHWGKLFDADGDGVPEPVYYNGFRADSDLECAGLGAAPHAHRLGIENLAMAGVQGRGVLIDLAAIYGNEPVAVNHAMLAAAIEAQRVEVRPGDFVLIYTGADRAILDNERRPGFNIGAAGASLDGADPEMLDWISRSNIVAICSDNVAVETVRMEEGYGMAPWVPIHDLCLFKLGIHLGELWYLEELALWLRDRKRSAFLLTAPPLRLPGSVGSPLTPIATV